MRLSTSPAASFALIDVNNFYVSCERLFNPRLAGRAVVVLSNNDGCVIARNAAAKALGIAMAVPYFQAAKLLRPHGGVALSSNYALYADMSNRVMRILASYSPQQEVYSIDECFLDMAGMSELATRGRQMRERIGQWVGLPVCVGFAASKTLAKLANHCAKKGLAGSDGVCDFHALPAAAVDRLLERLRASEVWGVGRRLGEQLAALGINSARQLRDADASRLRRRFSVTMERTIMELRGVSCLSLEEMAPAKQQIMCSRSFGQPVFDLADLREAVASYCARAAEKLRGQGSLSSAVQVYLQTNPFRPDEAQYCPALSVPLPYASADSRLIVRAALAGLAAIYRPGYRYKKAGVMLLGLQPAGQVTASLFETSKPHSAALMQAIDAINRRQGQGSIRLAAEGLLKPWQMRRERMSPCYTTSWQGLLQIG